MVVAEGFQSCIDIHLRMRPVTNEAVADYELDQEAHTVEWIIPRQAAAGMHNHQREKYNFSFTSIKGPECKQEEVFETVAQKVVLGVLDGYNGTVFAYGQTGSGKTYTITGGTERYVDRELYLELCPLYSRNCQVVVTMLEDEDNCFHLRNLSQHLATNEEEALNLLFVGDTNRMISATPMNLASSRSHCIFTVSVEARKAGEDTVRKSKLHLVDLAGSERVWKKGIDGQVLREAKYINLSLHYLEQVIIALQERSQGKQRHHVPYRNSMMTSVLRDALGGNCLTVMIATVTVAQEQLEETISTCRFAQRVAIVSNQVMLNEEVDPNLVIRRLKQEVKDLKEELHLLRGDQERGPLSDGELSHIRSQIDCYTADKTNETSLNCGGTMIHIRAAFGIFKELLLSKTEKSDTDNTKERTESSCLLPNTAVDSPNTSTLQETISNLNHQLQQRDNEINILVSFIRKKEKGTEKRTTSTQWPEILGIEDQCSLVDEKAQKPSSFQSFHSSEALVHPTLDQGQTLRAFDMFKSGNSSWEAMEENKKILKEKYVKAKALGENVNRAREKINVMKSKVEKLRVDIALQKLMRGIQPSDAHFDPIENQLISNIEEEKKVYKRSFSDLREVKKEIDNLNLLLQQSRVKLQMDFEKWLNSSKMAEGKYIQTANWEMEDESGVVRNVPHQSCGTPKLLSRPSSRARCFAPCVLPAEDQLRDPSTLAEKDAKIRGRNNDEVPRERSSSATLAQEVHPRLQLTGDVDTDADILAFYEARADILSMLPRN